MTLAAVFSGLPSVIGQGARGEQDPQRPEVIKVNTALVTVPVVVTDRYGQFVSDLSRNDFRMQENGEPQQIASFSSAEAPFNVALLIDRSRSTRNKLGAIRKAALNFIKQLQPKDRVLIVTFDEKVHFLGNFTSDRDELERAIRSVKPAT
ncbi:MAG TPA: VWA domain-containing protein [Pyrinomonadaceae bacterium]|nr:VWA domain-containing protein [Pyrinomonadaceae bacterium]